MKNRLQLNFSLTTQIERLNFISQYINSPEFQSHPLSDAELEKISNYILWGESPNPPSIHLESEWNDHPIETSYDELLESPTFNEAQFLTVPKKIRKQSFSREEARAKSSPLLRATFEDLWRRIDETDFLIIQYELLTAKRRNELPPRPELLAAITPARQAELTEKSHSLSQFQYLKLRHSLKQMRSEQYTLSDSYAAPIAPQSQFTYSEPERFIFDGNLEVRPLGLRYKDELSSLIFSLNPKPDDFKGLEKSLTERLWSPAVRPSTFYLDFTDEDHVGALLDIWDSINFDGDDLDSTIAEVFSTLKYYIERSEFEDIHLDILKMKKQHYMNDQICDIINPKYGKSYGANYISTIYRKKIIATICATALYHRELIENIFFEENWKRCRTCGQLFYIHEHNFVHKKKSKDGFSNQCKYCDKNKRNAKE